MPLYQNESRCDTIHMFHLQVHLHANQTRFETEAQGNLEMTYSDWLIADIGHVICFH